MGGVVDAVVDFVEGVVDFVVDAFETVVDFVGDVVGFVISPFGAFDTPEVPDPGSAATGVTVSKTGTNNQIPVVYGYRRVGGNIIFVESNGETNKYLYVVYACAEGEIYGFRNIIVNDVELPITSVRNPGTVYTVSEGRFSNRVKYQCFNGTESQGQSSLANEAATWGGKRRHLPGIAYVVMRFEWKNVESQEEFNPFQGGIPKVSFDIFGKKVYDVTTHGSGKDLSGTYASRTKKYEINPASCLLDYLTNPRYGAGLANSEIDAEAFKIAANKFNQTVNYSNSQSGRAMTMNAVISTQSQIFDNIKTLVSGARSIMPYVEGRYKLKVEDGGDPIDISSTTVQSAYDVTKEHIVGSISLIGETKRTKYNKVIVNYIDPDLEFTNQQKVYEVAADLTADNGEVLTGEFTFHTLSNPAIARDLAQMIYDKSRSQRKITFTATQELLDVEVGDVIRVTDEILDLDLQTFRVYSLKMLNSGLISIEAAEHDAALYPFTTGEQIELPPSLYLPDSYLIQPYVKELPFTPLSISVPLDPDSGTETNPPPNAPEVGYQGAGLEVFMPTLKPWIHSVDSIFIGNTTDNSEDFIFKDVRSALCGSSRYVAENVATYESLYQPTGPFPPPSYAPTVEDWKSGALTRNTGKTEDLFWMARKDRINRVKTAYNPTTGQYDWTNVTVDGYVMDLKLPANTEFDTLVFRSYDKDANLEFARSFNFYTGNTYSEISAVADAGITIYQQVGRVLQIPTTTANPLNINNLPAGSYSGQLLNLPAGDEWPYRTPYGGLYRQRNIIADFQGTTRDSRIEIRWRNSKTGQEMQDGSKLFDAHGFLFYNYKLKRGTNVLGENLEAYFNFLKDKYHNVTATAGQGGDTVGGSVIF